MSARQPAAELLHTEGALLTRTDLRALGLDRRGVDAVFRELDVVCLPGYSQPLIPRRGLPGATRALDVPRRGASAMRRLPTCSKQPFFKAQTPPTLRSFLSLP